MRTMWIVAVCVGSLMLFGGSAQAESSDGQMREDGCYEKVVGGEKHITCCMDSNSHIEVNGGNPECVCNDGYVGISTPLGSECERVVGGGGGGGGGGGPGGGGPGGPPPNCPSDQVPDGDGGCRDRDCDECAQARKDCNDREAAVFDECMRFDAAQVIDMWCAREDARYPNGQRAPVDWGETCYTECVNTKPGPGGEIICLGSREVCTPQPVASEECVTAWIEGMHGKEAHVGGGIFNVEVGESRITNPTDGMQAYCMSQGREEAEQCKEETGSDNCIDECPDGMPGYQGVEHSGGSAR